MLFAGALVASSMALVVPTPASALNLHIGPRGVGVGIGHRGYPGGYRGGFRHRGIFHHGFHHRGFRRF